MVLQNHEVLAAAEMVVECRQLKATAKCSMLGAAVTGATTFICGVVAGPIGLLVGAVGGGAAAYSMTKGKFKPLVTVLREDLTHEQKERLANHLINAMKDFDIADAVKLIAAISSQEALALIIISTVKKFIEGECRMTIDR